jgi:hypothetical protein
MNPLMITAGLTILATYIGTKPTTNQSDQLFALRAEAKRNEEIAIDNQVKDAKTFKSRGLSGQNYYLDKKKVSRERYVRHVLETMFRYRFPSVRPSWLKNPKTGRNMEIDCYCKEMNLSVEIDGEQHSKYIPYFHKKGYQEFLEMRDRDMMKTLLCKQRKMKLVRLPHTVADQDIEAYLLREINKVIK